MCKIVAFSNSKNLDIKKTSEAVGNQLLAIERDGFGYAVKGKVNVFGERCIADFFESRLDSTSHVTLPIVEIRQASFGVNDIPIGPAIFHGRTSTNDKGLLNCHPMTREGWHLIHNGVVTDHGPKYQKLTTNDSEDVLHRLIQGIEQVESQLTGYYAFCAIDPSGRLHVARDNIATLYIALCPSIDSYIIATTEELIQDITEELEIEVGPIDSIQSNQYMIFEGNELIFHKAINPRGYSDIESRHASRSIGRYIDPLNRAERMERVETIEGYLDDPSQSQRFNYYDEGIEDLMRELDTMDDTYSIEYHGDFITVSEYQKLDEVSKLDCVIHRPDGTQLAIDEIFWKGA